MEYVYVLDHSYEDNGYDEVKRIGAFSTEELAEKAIDALISKPGFKEYPRDCFYISCIPIDKMFWVEGFISESDAM